MSAYCKPERPHHIARVTRTVKFVIFHVSEIRGEVLSRRPMRVNWLLEDQLRLISSSWQLVAWRYVPHKLRFVFKSYTALYLENSVLISQRTESVQVIPFRSTGYIEMCHSNWLSNWLRPCGALCDQADVGDKFCLKCTGLLPGAYNLSSGETRPFFGNNIFLPYQYILSSAENQVKTNVFVPLLQ
jgi:hypothetical protein